MDSSSQSEEESTSDSDGNDLSDVNNGSWPSEPNIFSYSSSNSIMGGVMNHVPTAAGTRRRHTTSTSHSLFAAHQTSHSSPLDKHLQRIGGVPFHFVVMGVVTSALLLTCLCMFLPQYLISRGFMDKVADAFDDSLSTQRAWIDNIVLSTSEAAYRQALQNVSLAVKLRISVPPQRAVANLWGSMQTLRISSSSWTGQDAAQRRVLRLRAANMLQNWFRESTTIEDIGYDQDDDEDLLESYRSDTHLFVEDMHTMSNESCARKRGRPYSLFVAYDKEEHTGAQVNCSGYFVFDAAGGVAGQSTPLYTWPAKDGDTAVGDASVEQYIPTSRPYYHVQERLSRIVPPIPPLGAWSEVYRFKDDTSRWAPGLTWTTPITYCPDYSCFLGIVAASMSLQIAGDECLRAWAHLQRLLASKLYEYPLGSNDSSVFIVNHVSQAYPHQQGVLLGAADGSAMASSSNGTSSKEIQIINATDSQHYITRLTARAIMWYFNGWDDEKLQLRSPIFAFHVNASGDFELCHDRVANRYVGICYTVGTDSIQLDPWTRWLVVITLPTDAFSQAHASFTDSVYEQVADTEEWTRQATLGMNYRSMCLFLFIVICAVILGLVVSWSITRPLKMLSSHMRKLKDFKFRDIARSGLDAPPKIRELAILQSDFTQLARGMEVFAKFVPETVVRNIQLGDERWTRLHVMRKNVTIMFSDIRSFTTIAESLSIDELLLVLTRYLTEMTRIIENSEGVVAEVLGDGILAFWNTPDDVVDHPSKACAAALEQEAALGPMNQWFAEYNIGRFPGIKSVKLSIRVGLHTGEVFSGNIGSEAKMKFGCMGDPVNLASRLESLGKFYGVGIICSNTTRVELDQACNFQLRRLDLVQVEGKAQTTEIYELLGARSERDAPISIDLAPSEDRLARARIYENALQAYQEARFSECCQILNELLRPGDDGAVDVAATVLSERARGYVGPDGRSGVLSKEEHAKWTGVFKPPK